MNLFLTNEKNTKLLNNIKESIIEIKQATMRLSNDDFNHLTDYFFYGNLNEVLVKLRGIGLLELNGNVSYSGILEVDYLLDIIHTLRREEGPNSNHEIKEPSLKKIIEAIQATYIPLRALTTNGSCFRYVLTFHTLENIIDQMMILAYTEDEDVALETFCHLEKFATINGMYLRLANRILLSEMTFEALPDSSKDALFDLITAVDKDSAIKKQLEEDDDIDDERYDYIILEQFMKATFARKLESFNFQLSINGQVETIHNAEEFVAKVFNRLTTPEQVQAVFGYLHDYLITNKLIRYDDDLLVYALTHTSLDDLVILAIEENLFGRDTICYKENEEIVPNQLSNDPKTINLTHIQDFIAEKFERNRS